MTEPLKERLAYLKGLAEGLSLSQDAKESKLIVQMIDVLDELTHCVTVLSDRQDKSDADVKNLVQELSDMELAVFPGDEEELDGFVEYACPHCHDVVYYDPEIFNQEEDELCPNCGKPMFTSQGEETPELPADEGQH